MQENRKADVVIVGGGASGLAAAVELRMSSSDFSLLVIEKMKEPGRKIRATGSGRCNIANTRAAGYDSIKEFFDRIGLVTRSYDNGLVYPYSESASDVAELLIDRAMLLGAEIACSEEVISIKTVEKGSATGARFSIESKYKDEDGEHTIITEADYVILACGGKAGPSYGTTGDGYRLAKELGHSIVTPVPALTGIECREWEEGAISLAGTRMPGVVTLFKKGRLDNPVFREAGEIQFTKYGLSGICIFNMTRHMRLDRSIGEGFEDFTIKIDFFPEGDFKAHILRMRNLAPPNMPASEILCTVLKDSLSNYVAKGFDGSKALSELSEGEIDTIYNMVHGLEFHPVKLRGWQDAQVTMGGVSLDEIDEDTSESKIVNGLYITGELADRDFECGGFNLSNAWITGVAAADDIVNR